MIAQHMKFDDPAVLLLLVLLSLIGVLLGISRRDQPPLFHAIVIVVFGITELFLLFRNHMSTS